MRDNLFKNAEDKTLSTVQAGAEPNSDSGSHPGGQSRYSIQEGGGGIETSDMSRARATRISSYVPCTSCLVSPPGMHDVAMNQK